MLNERINKYSLDQRGENKLNNPKNVLPEVFF